MLVFCEYNVYKKAHDDNFFGPNTVVLNLSSYKEGISNSYLLPYVGFDPNRHEEFDFNYAEFLLKERYIPFMFVLNTLKKHINVVLLIHKDNGETFDQVNECLSKIILDMYGYHSLIANTYEDVLEWYTPKKDEFSKDGLVELEKDLKYVNSSKIENSPINTSLGYVNRYV